jgi:hypothetical protein
MLIHHIKNGSLARIKRDKFKELRVVNLADAVSGRVL